MHLLLPFLALMQTQTAYSVWVTDSTAKIQTTDLPTSVTTVNLKLARCEAQSFQVALRASKRVPHVSFTPAPLWNGSLSIPASSITWSVVGVLQTKYGAMPEVLLPVDNFNLPANTTIAMLVSVEAPCDARATSYTNAMYVRTSSGSTAVKIQADVYPFSIPKAGTPGALAHFSAAWSLSDFAPASDYQRYGDLMLSYRMSPENLWRNGVPDPAMLEHWYGLGLSGVPVYKADSAYLPAIDAFFANLARQPHGAELRAMSYFFGYDEKSRDYLDTQVRHGPSYTAVANAPDLVGARANLMMLHSHYPGVPTYSTVHLYPPPWTDPVGDLRYYGLSSIVAYRGLYSYADGALIRGTVDTGLVPRRMHGYRSYLGFRADVLAQPSLNARASFWSQYQAQADGFSYNNVNGWARLVPLPAIDPSTGPILGSYVFASNSTADDLIFRGTTGPLASMRMVAIRDGMQDYEYLYALAAQTESIETAREVAEQVSINWTLPKTSTTMQAARATIAGYLSQPSLARHPVPEHRSTGVTAPFLTWRSNALATKYDVYLGDSAAAVRNAGWKSPEYKGRTSMGGWRLALASGRTYYWRIDALTAAGLVCRGYVWRFTTGSEMK